MIVSIPSKSKAHSKLCQMLKMELTEFCKKKFDKVLIKVKNRLKFVKNRCKLELLLVRFVGRFCIGK